MPRVFLPAVLSGLLLWAAFLPLGLYQMIGFGWYFLGYTQHAVLPLIQIADLGGVYAVSFVVAAVNGAVADWALRSAAVRRWLSPANPDREGGGGSNGDHRATG